jgi:hypothetical protein
LALQSFYFFTLANDFLHAVKYYEASSFTSPPKEGVLQIFVILGKFVTSARFDHTNLGSTDKHTVAKTLAKGVQQFLNIIVINILQSRFIGQFDNVLGD